MPAFQDNKIAAGHNNTGGLINIGLIVPSGNIAFPEPVVMPSYNPGILRIRLDTLAGTSGFPSQIWLMPFLTYEQYDYLLATYCGGGQRGFVTIRTRIRKNPYANYNATLVVPTQDELANNNVGWGWQQVPLPIIRMVAA